MQMPKETRILAIDGGATNCRAMLCDQAGNILSYVEAGPVNYHSVGKECAANNLAFLLSRLSGEPLMVDCAVFGLAGLDSDSDRRILSGIVKDVLNAAAIQAEKLILENDGVMALNGAVGDRDGLLLISGTGSIVCAKNQAGLTIRVGGWGSKIGDEGSGYYIGMSAIRHVFRALDGRERPSGICPAILQDKCMADVEQLLDWIYSSQFNTGWAAALAPLICSLADSGDWKAAEIVDSAAYELGLMAVAAINRLSLNNSVLNTVLAGGVLQNNSRLHKKVRASIVSAAPLARFTSPLYRPIIGGIMLGLQSCGISGAEQDRIVSKIAVQFS